MKTPSRFSVAVMVALTALASAFLGSLARDGDLDGAAPLTVATADAMPVRHDPLPQGPIPCPDGSTVEFGQFCPVPTIQCANGIAVPLGQFCPRDVPSAKQAPPVATPEPVTCPNGTVVPAGQPCPTPKPTPQPVTCPKGTVVPAGQPCPTPKPTPPPLAYDG